MSRTTSLLVANTYIEELLDQLRGVRRADPDSVHQARVATRRLRAIMSLLRITHPERAKLVRRSARAVGRHLGRMRDLDILRAQLDRLEERVPLAATTIAGVRQAIRRRQVRQRRRTIKALEKLKIDRLRPLSPGDGRLLARMRPRSTARATFATLRAQIGERARNVASAVEHAAEVYFPNRLHAVRVAVKKLRYTVEVADRIALWRPPRLLRDLRRVQSQLGELHDLQVLQDTLDDLTRPISQKDAALLNAVVGGDIAGEYDAYMPQIERLRAICTACERFARHPAPPERRVWPVTAAAMAAHVALNLLADQLVSTRSSRVRVAGKVVQLTA